MKNLLFTLLIFAAAPSFANLEPEIPQADVQVKKKDKNEEVILVALDNPRTTCEGKFNDLMEIRQRDIGAGVQDRFMSICIKKETWLNHLILQTGGNF